MSENPLVFVSHSSKDAARANELVAELERRSITCWIAPRNIAAGTEYDDAIIQALSNCDALVVLISEDSISSRHVRSEVSRAASDGKRILPIRLVDVEIKGGLKFFLELSQYVDLFGNPAPEIIDTVVAALKRKGDPTAFTPTPSTKPASGSRKILFAGAVMALLAVIFVGYLYSSVFLGYLYSSMQQAAREEEAMRLQNIADSLQVYPLFELRRSDVVLASWSLNGTALSNWNGVSAHWLINGKKEVPFDYAMPREMTLSKAAGFSTLSLILKVPGIESPITRDFSVDIRKMIDDQTKAMGQAESAESITFPDGSVYIGAMKADQPHGQGAITYSDGSTYQGNWEAGIITGQGRASYVGGAVYEGALKAGKPEGTGVMTYPDGYRYEGDWKDGEREGVGSAVYPDGSIYKGDFKGGLRDGQGEFSTTDGFKYVGQWVAGEVEGLGVASYPGGHIYVGMFKAGEREGQGKLTYASGEVAEGAWQNGVLTAPPEAPAPEEGETPAAPAEEAAPAEPATNP